MFFIPPSKRLKTKQIILAKRLNCIVPRPPEDDDPLEFYEYLEPFARSVGTTNQKFQKKPEKNLGIARQSRIAGICYRKAAKIDQTINILRIENDGLTTDEIDCGRITIPNRLKKI